MADAQPAELATYHCLCANLLFATPSNLDSLGRRGQGALDQAIILHTRNLHASSIDQSNGQSSPVIVRREDGFEKRWLLKCPRCALAIGYHLDWSQFSSDSDADRVGRREDIVYILPGAVTTTDDMKAGKRPAEEALMFGLQEIK